MLQQQKKCKHKTLSVGFCCDSKYFFPVSNSVHTSCFSSSFCHSAPEAVGCQKKDFRSVYSTFVCSQHGDKIDSRSTQRFSVFHFLFRQSRQHLTLFSEFIDFICSVREQRKECEKTAQCPTNKYINSKYGFFIYQYIFLKQRFLQNSLTDESITVIRAFK